MLAKKTTLSALTQPVKTFPQVLRNVPVTEKVLVMSAPLVRAAISEAEVALGCDGRILVRPSGTEPLVRVMAEAVDVPTCEKCIDIVVKEIEACGFVKYE